MDKDAVIATLRRHRSELERLGIRHASLFGSVARGDAHADSDIDIAIAVDARSVPDVFTYVGLKERVAALFDGSVDVVNREFLRPEVRDSATPDLIDAF